MAGLRLNPETCRVVRDGVRLTVNPFDQRALALARRLQPEQGCAVTVATMGPPAARRALAHAYAAGANRCVLISDPAFAGSDTLATARVLAAATRRLSPDMVITGQHSIDSETGQVPEELAALLDWPCLPAVRRFDWEPEARSVVVAMETDEGIEAARAGLPVVVTTAERLMPPAKVGDDAVDAAMDRPVELWTAADLGISMEQVGVGGSPTWVADIQVRASDRRPVRFDPAADGDQVRRAADLVRARLQAPSPLPAEWPMAVEGNGAWVLIEAAQGRLTRASAEVLALARQVAAPVTAVQLTDAPSDTVIPQAAAAGADKVIVGHSRVLAAYTAEAWGEALEQLLDDRHAPGLPTPGLLIAPATRRGRGALARLAARRGLGLTGDALGIEIGKDGRLRHLKPGLGGNVMAPIFCRTHPELTTVVPGSVKPLEPLPDRQASVVQVDLHLSAPSVEVLGNDISAAEVAAALDGAELVLCVGNALSGPRELDLVRACLARLERATGLRGALAATRRVTDGELLPRQVQVGLTGRAIAPRLYVGIGVRGAAYHTCGISQCGIVVAINSDPQAPILEACDIGIVGDWRDLLPRLTDALALQVA